MANIVVSGHSFERANGVYIDQGGEGTDRFWTKAIPDWSSITEFVILYVPQNEAWHLYGALTDDEESGNFLAKVVDDSPSTLLPWQLDWFENDGEGNYVTPISVLEQSEQPSENIFGLPAGVVALIASRFGTVANFLRLRNQGQI